MKDNKKEANRFWRYKAVPDTSTIDQATCKHSVNSSFDL
jgi:hypothetical protein